VLHRSIIWPAAISFTTDANSGVDANQPNLSITLLTIVVILLSLGFLLSGMTIFYRQSRLSQPGQRMGTRHMGNVSRQGGKMAAILVLIIPLTVLFAGTYFSPPTSPTPLPLVAPGFLTIGVGDINNTSPPETYNDNGSLAGFDIDLIKAIAKAMNLEPKIIPTQVGSPDPLLDGLKQGKFDVVINAYSLTDEITKTTLHVSYLAPKDVVLVSKEKPGNLTFNALTDLCGHTIGVQDKTTELDTLNRTNANCPPQPGPIDIKTFPDTNTVANALLRKEVPAIYQSTPGESYYQSTKDFGEKFQRVGNPDTTLPKEAILIRQNNDAMRSAIEAAFNSLRQNGTYNKLLHTSRGDLSGDAIQAP
jgi:polar amino acid transport system substrate-binding protein